MPRVTIPGVGNVMFPDSMSDADIMAQAKQMQTEASKPLLDPRELGIGQLISGGFSRGIEGLKGTVADLIPALGASMLGRDEYAKEQLEEYSKRMAAEEEVNPTAYKSYKGVEGIGDVPGFVAETFGELGPDIISFMLGAGVGTTVGKTAAKKGLESVVKKEAAALAAKRGITGEAKDKLEETMLRRAQTGAAGANAAETGAKVGLNTGLWGTSLGTNVPDVFQSVYEDTGELSPGIALTIGSLVGALDTYLPGKVLKQLGRSGKERIAAEMLQKSTVVPTTWKKAFGAEVLKTAGGESLTESAQEMLSILGSQIAGDKDDFFSQENVDHIITSAVKGFIGGGTYGTPGAAVEAKRIKDERNNQIAQRQAIADALQPAEIPALGYTPQVMPVTPGGQAMDPQQAEILRQQQEQAAFEQRVGQPFSMEGYQGDLFEREKNLAEAEAALADKETAQAAEPIAQEVISEFKTTLDADTLKGTGLKPASGFFKKLLNKDMANPEDQAAVRDILVEVRNNPNLSESTKNAIESIAMQAFGAFAKQQEMFGPRGGVLKGADYGRARPKPPVTEPSGEGIQIPTEQTRAESTEGVAAPEEQGLDTTAGTISEPGVGEEAVGAPLEPTAEEDIAEQKRLMRRLADAQRAERRAEDLSENSKEKIALRKARAELDAFRAEADPRMERRTQQILADSAESQRRYEELTAELDANEALSQEEQDAIQAELQAEMAGEAAPVVEEGKAKPAKKRTKGPAKGVVVASPTEPAEPTPKVTTSTKAKKQAAAKAPKAVKEEKQPKVEGTKEFRDLEGSSSKDFVDFLGAGYLGFAKEDVTDIDDNVKVTNLLNNRVMVSPKSVAAKTYFSKMPRMVDNLINMAYDLAFNTPQFRSEGESKQEAKFFQGMNGANARLSVDWVRANLGKEANSKLSRFISGFEQARDAFTDKKLMALIMSGLSGTRENYQDETVQGYIDTLQEELASTRNRAERRAASGKTKKLEADAVVNIGQPLHPSIVSALRQGDIIGALRLFGASNSGMLSKLANRLAEVIGDTNIVIQENLVDEAGNPVAGFYDPKTNTIHIDATIGMNSHTLLHEAVHAVTSHILENASHVVTKQLQQLFDLVKGSLGSAYGATNLDEFVAEVKANPEMKALLQSINPNGEKITAWDKFVRIISNMLRRIVGMPPKPLESAFDAADRLVDMIISPAPDSRDAGKLFSVANSGTAGKVFDRLGAALESLPGMTPERADNVHEFLKNTLGGNFRSFMLSTLPLNALADIAKQKGLKNAMDVDRIVNERGGFEYKMNESIEPLVKRAETFAKTNGQVQLDLFNEVVYSSTLGKVDPTKPRTDYKTPEQLAEYDKVKANYNKLNANGKALYTQMRDAYKAMYQQIIESIGQRIDASVSDPATAKLIKKDIFDKLIQKGNIDPYFPLTRYGKYWLSYSARDASGQMEFYVEAFETERERSRMMAELQKEGATDIESFSNLSEINYRRVPSNSFVNSILQIMELNKVDPKATEEVMRLFLSTLPETAFAQSFQRRKETLGFKKDAIRALREKMYRTSHQIASMRYAAKLNAALDQMKDYARAVGKGTGEEAQRDNRVVNEYVKEFEKRINYINNPTVSKWSQVATSIGFNMTLGFNVSSAVINLTQIPLIVLPYLGGVYGFDATRKALQDAYGIHLRSGFDREVEIIGANGQKVKQKSMPALDNYNFDDPKLPPEVRRLKTLARIAKDQGQLNRSQLFDILETDDRNNPLAKINAASGFVFHHGERINRQVSLIAAYNLELDRLANPKAKLEEGGTAGDLTQEQKEEYAANRAIYLTEMTNGGISAAAAPRIAQSSLGKVLFMFKRYGVSMYYMLFKTAREALKNEDPEVRKAAMKQIAGIYGTAALFAGIQGLPLFGILAMVYNLFADDDEDDLESATRSYLGEFWYKGLFNYVTNVEIAGRTGLSDLIIRDAGKQDSQTVALTMMEMLGGPVYGVASKVERGLNMIRDGNVERGIENILPTSLGNIMKGIRYATEGTKTLRGDPITGEVNAWNIGAQMFGFAPADYTKQLEINSRLKGIDKKVNQEASKLKRQYYVATRVGDSDAKKAAKDKLLELGAKHRGLEINEATIGDVLDRSMKAQERATKETVNGVRYSSKMRKELLEMSKDMED